MARWRLLFFCCWVKVLFRGGRREAEAEGAVVAFELEGDGVEVGEEEDAVVGRPDGSGKSVTKDMTIHGDRVRPVKCRLRYIKVVV